MMHSIEKAMGLPNIGEAKKTLETVNSLVQSLDKEKLKTISHLLDTIVKIQQQGGPDGVNQFALIIQVISQVPESKLDKLVLVIEDVRGTIEAVQKLLKSLPPNILANINLGEIASEIKKEMGK
jgi:hypothetical protein